MAMAVGGKKKVMSDINITPLIDVVLVLLIIFMVITPILLRSLAAELPQPAASSSASTKIEKQVTLTISDDNVITIDGDPVTIQDLGTKIRKLFPPEKSDRTIMFSAGKKVNYGKVIEIFDICKGSGVEVIGIR